MPKSPRSLKATITLGVEVDLLRTLDDYCAAASVKRTAVVEVALRRYFVAEKQEYVSE